MEENNRFLKELNPKLEEYYKGCFLDLPLTIEITTTGDYTPTKEVREQLARKLMIEATQPGGPKLYLQGDRSRRVFVSQQKHFVDERDDE